MALNLTSFTESLETVEATEVAPVRTGKYDDQLPTVSQWIKAAKADGKGRRFPEDVPAGDVPDLLNLFRKVSETENVRVPVGHEVNGKKLSREDVKKLAKDQPATMVRLSFRVDAKRQYNRKPKTNGNGAEAKTEAPKDAPEAPQTTPPAEAPKPTPEPAKPASEPTRPAETRGRGGLLGRR